MRKDYTIFLIITLFLGLALRLLFINEASGNYAFEYMNPNNIKFPMDFFSVLATNAFAPLHYYYLQGWTFVFKDTGLSLKISSLLPCVVAIFTMFLCAKEYLLKKNVELCALSAAFFTAISAFLIYFSKVVGIYTLTFLIATLVLYYSLKVFNNPSNKNCTVLTVLSFLLILEHTISFVFVAFNCCALIVFMHRKKKENTTANNIFATIILCLPLIPFIVSLFAHPRVFSNWWVNFSWAKLCCFFTDLFSPVLMNATGANTALLDRCLNLNLSNLGFVFFVTVPTVMALSFALKAFFNERRANWYLLTVFLATFLTVLIGSLYGKIGFKTRYMVELYPILILLVSVGFAGMKMKGLKIVLATIFSFLTLFYIVVTPISPVKLIQAKELNVISILK